MIATTDFWMEYAGRLFSKPPYASYPRIGIENTVRNSQSRILPVRVMHLNLRDIAKAMAIHGLWMRTDSVTCPHTLERLRNTPHQGLR